MSFYVSDSLKTRVDESCLVERVQEEKDPVNEFSFSLIAESNRLFIPVKEVSFLTGQKTDIVCETNLKLVELILSGCKIKSLNLKKVSLEIEHSRIIKIIKTGQDSYNVRLECCLEKGVYND